LARRPQVVWYRAALDARHAPGFDRRSRCTGGQDRVQRDTVGEGSTSIFDRPHRPLGGGTWVERVCIATAPFGGDARRREHRPGACVGSLASSNVLASRNVIFPVTVRIGAASGRGAVCGLRRCVVRPLHLSVPTDEG
jgi:hypothetical protein